MIDQLYRYLPIVAIGLLAIILAPAFLVELMRQIGLLVVLGALLLLSLAAYYIRERENKRLQRLPQVRGAERTPILPHQEEQE